MEQTSKSHSSANVCSIWNALWILSCSQSWKFTNKMPFFLLVWTGYYFTTTITVFLYSFTLICLCLLGKSENLRINSENEVMTLSCCRSKLSPPELPEDYKDFSKLCFRLITFRAGINSRLTRVGSWFFGPQPSILKGVITMHRGHATAVVASI